MREEEYKRGCPECFKEFIARRTDQNYCSTKCRYDFHNRIARSKRKMVIPCDTILHRNREILIEFCKVPGNEIISKQQLIDAGFDFSYHTHSLQESTSKIKVDFVYEFGISPEGTGNYKIVKHAKL